MGNSLRTCSCGNKQPVAKKQCSGCGKIFIAFKKKVAAKRTKGVTKSEIKAMCAEVEKIKQSRLKG